MINREIVGLDSLELAACTATLVEELASALGLHACTETERVTTLDVTIAAGVMHSHDSRLLKH